MSLVNIPVEALDDFQCHLKSTVRLLSRHQLLDELPKLLLACSEDKFSEQSLKALGETCCKYPDVIDSLNTLLPPLYRFFADIKFAAEDPTKLENIIHDLPPEISRRFQSRGKLIDVLQEIIDCHDVISRSNLLRSKYEIEGPDSELHELCTLIQSKIQQCKETSCEGSTLKRPTDPPGFNISAKKSRGDIANQSCFDPSVSVNAFEDELLFADIAKHCGDSEIFFNFMKIISLFNNRQIDHARLVQLCAPFIRENPLLLRRFCSLAKVPVSVSACVVEPDIPDEYMEIDFLTSKRYGPSYRRVSDAVIQREQCSGRKLLDLEIQECLNDEFASYPCWSEDSSHHSLRSNKFLEYLSKIEEDRYEMDITLLTNQAAIELLDSIQKRMSEMSPEDCSRFRLDDTFDTGRSCSSEKASIRRIYASRFSDIMEGIKSNPIVAVPVVLKRLQEKQAEWESTKTALNKVWKHFTEMYYKKSLDYQSSNFKSVDSKKLRSKNLKNELEVLDAEFGSNRFNTCIDLSDDVLRSDVIELILLCVGKSGYLPDDKLHIELILKNVLCDFLMVPRMRLSTGDFIRHRDERQILYKDARTIPKSCDHNAFIGNFAWFCFLKSFQLIYQRLQYLLELSQKVEVPSPSKQAQKKQPYDTIFTAFRGFYENKLDSNQVEKIIRDIFPTEGYRLLTLERHLNSTVKYLFSLSTNVANLSLLECYSTQTEQASKVPLSIDDFAVDLQYYSEIESLFMAHERVFIFVFYQNKNDQRLVYIKNWKFQPNNYVSRIKSQLERDDVLYRYLNAAPKVPLNLSDMPIPVFLPRNLREKEADDECYVTENSQMSLTNGKMEYTALTGDYFFREKFASTRNGRRKKLAECKFDSALGTGTPDIFL